MWSSLFVSLLLAHLAGDYLMQRDTLCEQKREKKAGSWFLYVHSLIIAGLSWLALGAFKFWYVALAIGVSHFLLDWIKAYTTKDDVWYYSVDQVCHILILAIAAFVCVDLLGWSTPIWLCKPLLKAVAVVATIIVCDKPANLFISGTLRSHHVTLPKASSSSFHAGKLIGTLERWLILIFIVIGRYEVIGFLIAAKSIIRFGEANKSGSGDGGEDDGAGGDTDKDKTEYFLAGTLLSITIAVGCGLLLKYYLQMV